MALITPKKLKRLLCELALACCLEDTKNEHQFWQPVRPVVTQRRFKRRIVRRTAKE